MKVVAILETSWNQRVRVEELATIVGLSQPRLQHLFKRDVGVSITAYLKKRQLTEAAALLARTQLRVSEICYQTGFHDLSNFDHFFRQTFGVSPRQFRLAKIQHVDDRTHQ